VLARDDLKNLDQAILKTKRNAGKVRNPQSVSLRTYESNRSLAIGRQSATPVCGRHHIVTVPPFDIVHLKPVRLDGL
jgi:hypothetical protein